MVFLYWATCIVETLESGLDVCVEMLTIIVTDAVVMHKGQCDLMAQCVCIEELMTLALIICKTGNKGFSL